MLRRPAEPRFIAFRWEGSLSRSGRYRFAAALDFRGRVVVLLFPLGDPARQPADGETDGEHVGRYAHRAEQDAAVEIDVRIELPIDEVRIGQREFFEFAGDAQQRVLPLDLGKDLVAGLLENLRPRIVVPINAVAEAIQSERIRFVLGVAQAVFGRQSAAVNAFEHVHHLDVRPAVQRSPEAHTAAAHEANRLAFAEPTIRTVDELQFCS